MKGKNIKRAQRATATRVREAMPEPGASDREVAEFWDTHSVADYWDDLEPVTLTHKPAPRQVVTLRLDPKAAQALRTLARRRGMNYSTLARAWISERLRDELKAETKAGGR
jgi:hypothetical protein